MGLAITDDHRALAGVARAFLTANRPRPAPGRADTPPPVPQV